MIVISRPAYKAVSNMLELASALTALNQDRPSRASKVLSMHAGVRPVPLEIVIQSFDIANLEARMSAMARPAYTAVSNMLKEAATPADAKSAILFVPTRKQARQTALSLLTYAAADGEDGKFLQVFPAPPLLAAHGNAGTESITPCTAFVHLSWTCLKSVTLIPTVCSCT